MRLFLFFVAFGSIPTRVTEFAYAMCLPLSRSMQVIVSKTHVILGSFTIISGVLFQSCQFMQ